MAPRNIGVSVPIITPIAATAPATPPRYPLIFFPAVKAINVGSRYLSMGETMIARCSLGNQPPGMNIAVMSPHAMNAPIFGITIALRLLPNCCIDFLIETSIITKLGFIHK